jgi:hypothetical protein
MTTFVITNLDRPGHYWTTSEWVNEYDGSYKSYTSEARANRAAVKLIKAGRRVDVVRNPAEVRSEIENNARR